MAKDYYKTLGVEKSASKDEIKTAYKRLAKRYHPDLNKDSGATEKFKEINEAASVLGDDTKRSQYDQFGTADFSGFQGGTSGFDFSDFTRGGGDFDFDSIFDSFFGGGMFSGGGRRRGGARRGSDLVYDMEIDLEEAATGAEKHIMIPKLVKCEECNGKGTKSKSDTTACDECGGSGMVRHTRRTPFGMFTTATTCRRCHGEGTVIKHPCLECHGKGVVEDTTKIKFNIPAGVDTGIRLRVAGEGEAGEKGGPSGDLYVRVHVRPNKIFQRQGDDIYAEAQIPFAVAALGGEVEVPTLDGKATMKIPAGTQSDTIFKLREKGIPNLNGYGIGDEKVKVIIEVPKRLTKKQKELLEEFDEEEEKSSKGFFGKIKDSF